MKSFFSPKSRSSGNQIKIETNTIKHELLLRIPGCIVNLIEEGKTIELGRGDFSVYILSDQNIRLATIIKVADNLQWPLTKDEPVVKLDGVHYLFTLPMKEGDSLNYGVAFSDRCDKKLLGSLDAFLVEHSCFSCLSKSRGRNDLDWQEFAPKVEAYNGVLARAIAGGTGQIVKGIFMCSNAYTNQVQNEGDLILSEDNTTNKGRSTIAKTKSSKNIAARNNSMNQNIKRVRTLSDMTQQMSKTMLNGVGLVTGSVMGPLVNSKQGRAFLSMMPGEVLLASFDAVDKIMCAAEAAEQQALQATSGAAVRMVSIRYGDNAGEATGDALATAGHCAGTAWNILKIRRAMNPASVATSGAIRSTGKAIKY
ncbi:hypothetical protein SOVF_090470 [Spinacia oleracea]|uniref:Senescence/dehydration-associated protein At4g35985, chloroplastic n=1 Tax=Spinacia oleracea TaxID=3562 RepID=A0A9R0JF57_SPIOL|nr:senescence/dehydration-associated protein At4g35985, chloroplastic-like [Spinacia oleracea]KNA16297.1 hypothetical protein SOVF_090470 [Spinacia oleracea]